MGWPKIELGPPQGQVGDCEDHLPSGTSSPVTTTIILWHIWLEINLPYNPQNNTGN